MTDQTAQGISPIAPADPRRRLTWAITGGLAGLIFMALGLIGGAAGGPGMMAALALSAGCGALVVQDLWRARRHARAVAIVADLLRHDPVPSFLADETGQLILANRAADARFRDSPGVSMAEILRGVFANPAAVVVRLQARARDNGLAREDVATRRGTIRLQVRGLSGLGLLWRIEEGAVLPDGTFPEDGLPVVTLGRSGAILAMNAGARDLLGPRAGTIDRIFADLPPRFGAVNRLRGSEGLLTAAVHLQSPMPDAAACGCCRWPVTRPMPMQPGSPPCRCRC